MKCASYFLAPAFLATSLLGIALGKPVPQAVGGSSTLLEFDAAPTPAFPIGGSGDFVSIDSPTKLFKIGGKVQKFVGTNTWWLAYTKDNADIDRVLADIAKSGLPVTRAWGFGETNEASSANNNFFQELKGGKQLLNFDPATGVPKLDYVVSQAEKAGVKLIVPLLNGNGADLGGIDAYMKNYGDADKKAFYTSSLSQAAYLKYVDFIVNRYKTSPAIFSWEICNEPQYDCVENCDTTIITQWAKNVSKHIKTQDPSHLVSLGDEGWFAQPYTAPQNANQYPYKGPKGIDFAKNLAIPDIDFGTFHMYPDQWKIDKEWGNTYIKEHAKVGKECGKPVILEEYGVTDPNERIKTMRRWQDTIVAEGLAGDLFWQFSETLKDTQPVDFYGVTYDQTAGSVYDEIVLKHVKAMSGQATVGGY